MGLVQVGAVLFPEGAFLLQLGNAFARGAAGFVRSDGSSEFLRSKVQADVQLRIAQQ